MNSFLYLQIQSQSPVKIFASISDVYKSLIQTTITQVLCDIVMMIGNKLPTERRNLIGIWVTKICKSYRVSNSKLAKCLASVALTSSSASTNLAIAQNMASELLHVVGSDETDPLEISETFPIINKSTDAAIASTLMQFVESTINDLDWITTRLKAHYTAQKSSSLNQKSDVVSVSAIEELVYSRSEDVVNVLSHFAAMNLKGKQVADWQVASISTMCCMQLVPNPPVLVLY